MIKYMDKVIIVCMLFAAAVATYLAFSGKLLYVG